MYNVTHMYLPNKRSSLLLLHSRIPLIECASEYSESLAHSLTCNDTVNRIYTRFAKWNFWAEYTIQAYTNTLNPFPSLASEKKCIREYIFIFATLYSRYESYSSLGVFVPALLYNNYYALLCCKAPRTTSWKWHSINKIIIIIKILDMCISSSACVSVVSS